MLSVVCWKWTPAAGYRSAFGPSTVNILKEMVRRHYSRPHRFICVTDDATGLDPDVEVIPLWDDHAGLANPFGPGNPSCYRRLKMFSPDAADLFGERFVSLDLDTVVTGDLSPIWDRPEDFVAWGDTNHGTHYNGSMMLMTAGARACVWEDFDPVNSPRLAKAAGQFGSDQGWISYRLGSGEATWTTDDGVYSFRNHLSRPPRPLPDNARLVMFHGRIDPWSGSAQRLSWVCKHYAYAERAPGVADVQAVNLGRRIALLTDGRTAPITQLLDAAGDETHDPSDAAAFVAGAGRQWFAGLLSHFHRVTTQ